MKILLAICLIALSGCASILGSAPTFEYCNEVQYTRKGNQIDVVAHCNAPIGGGALPLTMPK
jgi:uncharacterized protein YceK